MINSTEYKIWIDALDFESYGQWKMDTQFTHLIGSGYLIACHAPGVPVQDAETSFKICETGNYRIWARTRNWYYRDAPGKFCLAVDGKTADTILGAAMSNEWLWEIAGDFLLTEGVHQLSLKDLTGYFGRCSSIIITNDMNYVPPRPVDEFEAERAACVGISLQPQLEGAWDVIVAGGGPGGVPSAIMAARQGRKVLLLTNRSLLGGNASEEAGVLYNGASARQPNARDGGITEEIIRLKANLGCTWTQALTKLCEAESNLTIQYNKHVCGVNKSDTIIESIWARDTVKGTRHLYQGIIFIDSTGDSWLAYHAGAKYRVGRESEWQNKEIFAPQQADLLTMSGTLMNPVMLDTGKPVPYTSPSWVETLPEGEKFGRNIEHIGMIWWAEAPNALDDIYDAELARDEIFRVYLAYFNYLKNLWEEKEKAANYVFSFMNHIDAKRESRRVIGDYILNQEDCMEGRHFFDTVCHAGWPIDLHHPKGIYSGEEGPFFSNTHVPLVCIPYRSLYSVNVDNLFMAGRNISVTHVALGTTRLQSTISNMGQAVGIAAAMCIEKQISPRQLGSLHLEEYRQRLLKEDQFIPELKNTDSKDLARSCKITASSVCRDEMYRNEIGIEGEILPLDRQRATFIARGVSSHIQSLWIRLTNTTEENILVPVHLRTQADPDAYTTKEDLCVMDLEVFPGEHWLECKVDQIIELRYFWLWIDATPGLGWRIWKCPPLDWTRSERFHDQEKFENIRWESHCVSLTKPMEQIADCRPENIINGFSRIHSAKDYGWVSDKKLSLPQWIGLEFEEFTQIDSVYLVFDTDMTNNAMLLPLSSVPFRVVTAYRIEAETQQGWEELVSVQDNYQRRRVHHFPAIAAKRLRIHVLQTGGDTARIFEVRIYKEGF